jgi:hypothetical protein
MPTLQCHLEAAGLRVHSIAAASAVPTATAGAGVPAKAGREHNLDYTQFKARIGCVLLCLPAPVC